MTLFTAASLGQDTILLHNVTNLWGHIKRTRHMSAKGSGADAHFRDVRVSQYSIERQLRIDLAQAERALRQAAMHLILRS